MEYGRFEIQHLRNDDGGAVVKLSGEIDIAAQEEVLTTLEKCLDAPHVVVDTSDVTFLDSIGLGTIIHCGEKVGQERLRLVPGKATERILDLTGTRSYFGL